MFLNHFRILNLNLKHTISNSVYKQLLSVPVRAYKVSFSTNMAGLGKLIIASISRSRSALVHATAHTRERWALFKKNQSRYMRQLKFLIGIFTFYIVLSCEPVYRTELVNKTSEAIILNIKFDKAEIESVWQGRPYIEYVRGRNNGGGLLLNFDTINLSSLISINPQESFVIQGGIGTRPDFFGLKYINIYGEDTIRLENKDEMKKAFIQTGARKYQLFIK
jgi:hypothetical protein